MAGNHGFHKGDSWICAYGECTGIEVLTLFAPDDKLVVDTTSDSDREVCERFEWPIIFLDPLLFDEFACWLSCLNRRGFSNSAYFSRISSLSDETRYQERKVSFLKEIQIKSGAKKIQKMFADARVISKNDLK